MPSKLTAEPRVSGSVPGITLNDSARTFLSMVWWGLNTFSCVDPSCDLITNNDSIHDWQFPAFFNNFVKVFLAATCWLARR